jgi:hypothetical protein
MVLLVKDILNRSEQLFRAEWFTYALGYFQRFLFCVFLRCILD